MTLCAEYSWEDVPQMENLAASGEGPSEARREALGIWIWAWYNLRMHLPIENSF